MTDIIFCGVDGEMTGTELSEKAKLCQIGVAFEPRKCFTSDIGWSSSNYIADPKALEVNRFTTNRIEKGPMPEFIDELLSAFLEANGGLPDKKILIPVGFNVGSFDMPFIKDALPNSWQYFSRRTVDLNAICFTLDGRIEYEGSFPTWKGWKRLAKSFANETISQMNIPGSEHDAGYDAIQAILCFHFLRSIIVGNEEGIANGS